MAIGNGQRAGSQRTRRRRGQDTPSERQAAPGQDTPWRQLSSPLRRRFPQPRWSARLVQIASFPARAADLQRPAHLRPLENAEEMAAPALGEILRGHQSLSSSSATSTGETPTGHQTPVSSRASIRPERLRQRACLASVATQARHGPVLCGDCLGQSGASGDTGNKRPRMGIRQVRYGVEAEGFEHSIIGSIRDDEDAHAGWTLGELAMRRPGRTDRRVSGSHRRIETPCGRGDRHTGVRTHRRGIGVPDHCERLQPLGKRIVIDQDFESAVNRVFPPMGMTWMSVSPR